MDFDEILEKIKNNDKSLTNVIDFFSQQLGNEKIQKLMEALKNNFTITTLNIIGNNIDSSGAETIANMLEENKHLQILLIGSNKISDDDAIAIDKSLEKNKHLVCLSAYDNQISDEGAKYLLTALKHNNSLECMYLGYNKIEDPAIEAQISEQQLREWHKIRHNFPNRNEENLEQCRNIKFKFK